MQTAISVRVVAFAVLRYFDLRAFLFFVDDFLLARLSSLAIFFSLGFAKSIVRMTLFSVLDIAPSSHWMANNATINEPGFGASGFAATDPRLGRRDAQSFSYSSSINVCVAARSVAYPRLVKLGFRYYKEAHPPSERGGSYDLPALRRHRPGEQTNLRRVWIADALEVQCMRE